MVLSQHSCLQSWAHPHPPTYCRTFLSQHFRPSRSFHSFSNICRIPSVDPC